MERPGLEAVNKFAKKRESSDPTAIITDFKRRDLLIDKKLQRFFVKREGKLYTQA